jgi:hypothetical protein
MEKPFFVKLLPGKFKPIKIKSQWRGVSLVLVVEAALVFMFSAGPVLQAREKDKLPYGEGLIVNIPFPEAQVEQVVQDVVQNGLIHGTKEYSKDQYISGAQPADSTHAFPQWTGAGKVFYKVRLKALDPRDFKDSGDVGTVAVRYVIQPQGDKNTVLRIDAVFVEDFRKIVHPSDGSVESSEYKDIHDHLDAIDVMRQQTVEAENERQEMLQKKQLQAANNSVPAAAPAAPVSAAPVSAGPATATSAPAVANPGVGTDVAAAQSSPSEQVLDQTSPGQTLPGQTWPGQTLEQYVKDLRHQVERLVKAPGAPLKSAPFHTATTLNPLQPGTEVLILISTPYWYGVETREGQHGWLSRDELEPLP